MSETRPTAARRPRSEARRAQMAAQPEPPLRAPPQPPPTERESLRRPAGDPLAATRARVHDTWAFEDTSTVLEVPEQRTFLVRQPPIFWIVASVLMVAMFSVLLAVGIDAWRAAEAAREETRRLRLIAEEKAKYKLLHRDLIDAYAASQGIDPALVAAVIYHESRFDASAVSRVGARGLMQIMDETGGWIAGKLGEGDAYTQDSLFNPETNIRYGTWYLGFLSRMFDGDLVKIAAGYHAGQNQVVEWLADPVYSPDGNRLVTIPFPDTEQYVSRVVNAYEIYTRHYYTPEETPSAEAAS